MRTHGDTSSGTTTNLVGGIEAIADIGGERCFALIGRCRDDPDPSVRKNVDYWIRELKFAMSKGTSE